MYLNVPSVTVPMATLSKDPVCNQPKSVLKEAGGGGGGGGGWREVGVPCVCAKTANLQGMQFHIQLSQHVSCTGRPEGWFEFECHYYQRPLVPNMDRDPLRGRRMLDHMLRMGGGVRWGWGGMGVG